jgi:3-deoxy-D-glycero-D-galacto-nononate 9-phosphate synthase
MTYIIAEIGQNHNGSVDLAKLLIDFVARPVTEELFGVDLKGMDAVKLTKRDLKHELSTSEMKRVYDNKNSFGQTYLEHREFLELNDEEHHEIFLHAKSYHLDFVETLCSPSCLSLFKHFTPDFLKVASRDLTNPPLLEAMGETKVPIILSTGMSGKSELDRAIEIIARHHSEITILHCVSEYPTHPANVNLRTIDYLYEHYPDYRIGYSDHTVGIMTPIAAVARGARVIEKHVTIDRRMKGTDQAGSLGPDGILRMVRDIRLLEMGMGEKDLFISPTVKTTKEKLERSVAAKRAMKVGEVIEDHDLQLLSPGTGLRWDDRHKLLGMKLIRPIYMNEIFSLEHVELKQHEPS